MHNSPDTGPRQSAYSQLELVRAAVRRYLKGDPDFVNLDCLRQQTFNRRQLDRLARELGPRQV